MWNYILNSFLINQHFSSQFVVESELQIFEQIRSKFQDFKYKLATKKTKKIFSMKSFSGNQTPQPMEDSVKLYSRNLSIISPPVRRAKFTFSKFKQPTSDHALQKVPTCNICGETKQDRLRTYCRCGIQQHNECLKARLLGLLEKEQVCSNCGFQYRLYKTKRLCNLRKCRTILQILIAVFAAILVMLLLLTILQWNQNSIRKNLVLLILLLSNCLVELVLLGSLVSRKFEEEWILKECDQQNSFKKDQSTANFTIRRDDQRLVLNLS